MRAQLARVAMVALGLWGCGSTAVPDASRTDAGPSDAGPACCLDAGTDAGRDPSRPDASWWDGEELPPVAWDLPECVVDHGVLDRVIIDRGAPGPSGSLDLDNLAAGGGTVLVLHEGGRASYLKAGTAVRLTPPTGYVSISARTFAVHGEELRGAAALRSDDDVSQSVYLALSSGSPPLIVPRGDSPFHVAAEMGVESRIHPDGSWQFLGTPSRTSGMYAMVVDRDLNVARATLLSSELLPHQFGESASQLEHAQSPAGSMLVFHQLDIHEGIGLIPYDEASKRPEVRLEEPMLADGWDDYERLEAAADGDVVVVQYSIAHRHGAYAERYAEVSLETGALLRGPEPFGEDGLPFYDLELSSAPDGGIDVVQVPASIAVNPDLLYNSPNPLHVYLGVPRPLRLEEHTPLRVGAGAFPVRYFVRRDDDRLVIAWMEEGPTSGERVAQGIYWAVLRCDP